MNKDDERRRKGGGGYQDDNDDDDTESAYNKVSSCKWCSEDEKGDNH